MSDDELLDDELDDSAWEDRQRRYTALAQAVDFTKLEHDADADTVVRNAEKFYSFLKGE